MSPGKGTQVWKRSGAVYEGDWKFGKRDGYGVLSHPDPETGKLKRVYSGWWKGDKKSVSAFPACLVCRQRGGPRPSGLLGGRRKGWRNSSAFQNKTKKTGSKRSGGPREKPFKNSMASRRQQAEVSSTLFPTCFLAFFSGYPILRILLLLAQGRWEARKQAWRCRAGISAS